MSQANYRVVKSVQGTSSQVYVFGLGGLSRKSLRESAMSEMSKNANLTGAQAIVNTNIQYKSSNYVIVNKIEAIATGTVIEFLK